MLTAELLPALAPLPARTPIASPSSDGRWGGYGALLLAETLGHTRVTFAAVDAPALWLRAADTADKAFDDSRGLRPS